MPWASSIRNIFSRSGAYESQTRLNKIRELYSSNYMCRIPNVSSHIESSASAISGMDFHGYQDVKALIDLDRSVGTGECVSLVQTYVPEIGNTSTWRPGPNVKSLDDDILPPGTVIATFWNKTYPSRSGGNHAAFYLGHNEKGIQVVEQWRGSSPKEAKSKRSPDGIQFRGVKIPDDQTGDPPDMTNIGEYYYVVLKKR